MAGMRGGDLAGTSGHYRGLRGLRGVRSWLDSRGAGQGPRPHRPRQQLNVLPRSANRARYLRPSRCESSRPVPPRSVVISPIMLPTLARRAVSSVTQAIKATPAIYGNPYQTKRIWPPDFTKMTPQQHLRFEKKFKRRIKLAHARPGFHKKVKLAQLFAVTCMDRCAMPRMEDRALTRCSLCGLGILFLRARVLWLRIQAFQRGRLEDICCMGPELLADFAM